MSKKKKRTHYLINSNIIDFWYTYCFNHVEELDRGEEENVYEGFLHHFPTFYGRKFESMVIRLLPGLLKAKGIGYRSIGKDWGNDYEFDFVVENGDRIYIGEIKAGDLNVSAEIGKIESIVRQEDFYRNKETGYIFIAGRFSSRIENSGILYVDIEEFFEQPIS